MGRRCSLWVVLGSEWLRGREGRVSQCHRGAKRGGRKRLERYQERNVICVCIYIYIVIFQTQQHVTLSAPPLTPVSSICSIRAPPCSLRAYLCSPCALQCSLDAPPCSPSVTSYFHTHRRFLASLSETLCTAGSGCSSDSSIYGSVGCPLMSLSSFLTARPHHCNSTSALTSSNPSNSPCMLSTPTKPTFRARTLCSTSTNLR